MQDIVSGRNKTIAFATAFKIVIAFEMTISEFLDDVVFKSSVLELKWVTAKDIILHSFFVATFFIVWKNVVKLIKCGLYVRYLIIINNTNYKTGIVYKMWIIPVL